MNSRVQRILKRILDAIVASVALILLFPLLVLVALSIWVSMGPPAMFRQTRAGYFQSV